MGTFTATYTVWEADSYSERGGRFAGTQVAWVKEMTAAQARTALMDELRAQDRLTLNLLAEWDRGMRNYGQANVHIVFDGSPSEPLEYGIRYSYKP